MTWYHHIVIIIGIILTMVNTCTNPIYGDILNIVGIIIIIISVYRYAKERQKKEIKYDHIT